MNPYDKFLTALISPNMCSRVCFSVLGTRLDISSGGGLVHIYLCF